MLFSPGNLSVIACPAQRQSGEAVRPGPRVLLVQVGTTFRIEHVYGSSLRTDRGCWRCRAATSIRGLTVDGWIVADEAARLSEDLIAALRPMRARRPEARFVMLSTAWSRTDPFWTVWDNETILDAGEGDGGRPGIVRRAVPEQERRALGEANFKREYLGIRWGGGQSVWLGLLCAPRRCSAAGAGGPRFGRPRRRSPCWSEPVSMSPSVGGFDEVQSG